MKISVREAQVTDIDQIRFLFRDTVRHVNAKDYSAREINVWAEGYKNIEGWKKNLSEQYFLVAQTDTMIVGFASMTDLGLLDYLYIDKNFQRKGVATSLLAAIESRAEKLSLKEITAQVSKTAIPFFESKGFIKTGDVIRRVQDVEFVNAVMTKQLRE